MLIPCYDWGVLLAGGATPTLTILYNTLYINARMAAYAAVMVTNTLFSA